MPVGELTPVIETERLRLRATQGADADWIAEQAGDIDVARMTTRMPHPYSRADAESFLEVVAQADPAKEAVFAVERQDGEPIGVLGFHPKESGQPEIGYWLGRRHWGRGYATEAAQGALDWAKHGWRKRWMIGGHFADNPASGQVLCKAGFLYTGETKLLHSVARGAPAATRMMVWLA
jgi:RimJ/RimL family protein N-acetyltransferase